ncbi:MAG TPA: metallophosphoesterase family protein, partial [Thermoleophilaceae bacterium]
MRYGVAGDVHGNVHALRTVLEALRAAGAERIVCPGDVVGYGPRPDECVEMLADAGALVVAGNHDLMAIGRLPIERTGGIVRTTIEWTRSAISEATRSWLADLPLELRTPDGLLVTHGGLGDPERYVRDRPAAAAELENLRERDPSARALLLGHTHRPMAAPRGAPAVAREGGLALDPARGPWLLNAGSVGQSREARPVARALVFDSEGGAESARFLELSYDVRATRRELRA